MGVIKSVIDVAAVAPVANGAGPSQEPHCLRDLRVGRPNDLGHVTHAQLARFQQRVQDPHPSRITQQAKQLRQVRRHVLIDQRLGNDCYPSRVGRRYRTHVQIGYV